MPNLCPCTVPGWDCGDEYKVVPDLKGLEINMGMSIRWQFKTSSGWGGCGREVVISALGTRAGTSCQGKRRQGSVTKEVTLELSLEHKCGLFQEGEPLSQSFPLVSFFHSIKFSHQFAPPAPLAPSNQSQGPSGLGHFLLHPPKTCLQC